MNTETTTGEYLLLFRGPQWDKGLSTEELDQVMDKVTNWFESLKKQGKIKAGQALSVDGRIISAKNGRALLADGPFAESKEAVGGYLLVQADDLNEALAIGRSNPTLEYGISIEVRPVLAECPMFQRARERLAVAAA
jgi:hypothetical protein